MKIGSLSRLILFILLHILFILSKVVKSQEIGVDQYSFNGNGRASCQKYEDITRRYKKLENILNGLKSQCKEGFNAFSQDINERPFPADNACTVKNSKYIMRRVEYTEKLINRVSEFCKINDYSTTTSPNIEDKTSATERPTEETSVVPAYEASTPFSTTNSSDGYPFILLNPSMVEAFRNNYPGNEVWYPPLYSFFATYLQYRTCFIKVGAVNANNNLLFRVISRNNDSTVLGIHEKGLTNGATCIEYRCSVRNPDFAQLEGNDFYRYPLTYTLVHIIPIGQTCFVSGESSSLRVQEQSNMGLSSLRSDIGNTIFEANIPATKNEGIFFHESKTFDEIPEARNMAIGKCNNGNHYRYSDDMIPNVGLATTFTCI